LFAQGSGREARATGHVVCWAGAALLGLGRCPRPLLATCHCIATTTRAAPCRAPLCSVLCALCCWLLASVLSPDWVPRCVPRV
jgi:hypothetical protein